MPSPNGIAKLPRCNPGRPNALRQVVDLQNRVYELAKLASDKPRELTLLTRAWCELEERKRILRGRPLPGMLKPLAKPSKARKTSHIPLEVLPTSPEQDDARPSPATESVTSQTR